MKKGAINMFWKFIFINSFFFANTSAQFYEDKRCRCICPTPTSILNSTDKSERTLYIAYVPPNKCNCDGVILPRVSDEVRDNAQLFCPRCECKYETRNTTVILVVVILVLWMLMLLIGYYLFLMLLECLVSRKQKSHAQNYAQAERTSEEIEILLDQGEDIEN